MESTGKIISAVIITGAVFTLFLYSPVASPELYKTNGQLNVMIHPNKFLESRISRLSKSGKRNLHQFSELQITNPIAESHNTLIQTDTKEFDPFGQNSVNRKNIYSTSQSKVRLTDRNFIFPKGKSVASSGKIIASNVQNHGFMALNSDTRANGSTVPETTDGIQGNTNPGDQPTGNVLPISDGLVLMLLMSLGFAGWKRIRIRKTAA